ncbi:MAG: tetratricopeptide repeat protein [Allosphingosinicella sp.]
MNALILGALLAAAAPPPEPVEGPPIVITAQSPADAEAALRACLARHCPPNEDIDASLALAETLLDDGKYHPARKVLLKSLSRNKDKAKAFPVPVSDLYRANGRVAAHLGLARAYIVSTLNIYQSLKAGLPEKDARLLGARMEIAEMLGSTRGHWAARAAYERIADAARREGRPDIAAMAELRSIMRHSPPEEREAKIKAIAASPDPELRAAVLEARLALVNIAAAEGRPDEAKLLLSALSGVKLNRPVLIYAPPYTMVEQELDSSTDTARDARFDDRPVATARSDDARNNSPFGVNAVHMTNLGAFSTVKRLAPNFEDMWIDVGFWVTREGKVDDLKVLKKKGNDFWAAPLLASIRGRLYTAGNGIAIDSYRVERYTYTSHFEPGTGSHLQGRSTRARIEYLDLSGDGLVASQ